MTCLHFSPGGCLLLLGLLIRCCNAQEAPSFLTPTFAPNITHRQSFCGRHDLVNGKEVERRDALRGMELHVGMSDYYLSQEGIISPKDPDISAMVLDELAKRAGFTWRNSHGVVRSPSDNETWDSTLYWSTDVYDMNMDWWIRSIDRLSHGTLFPEGWKDGSFIMVGKEKDIGVDESFNIWAVAAPFEPEVWYLIIGTIFITALVLWGIQVLEGGMQKSNAVEALYLSAFSFAGHWNNRPRSIATKVISLSICIVSLICVAAYTANLASFLILLNQPSISITSIQDAITLQKKFCILPGSGVDFGMRVAYPHANYVRNEATTEAELFLALDRGECDLVISSMGGWLGAKNTATYNAGCSKSWIGKTVLFQQSSFAINDSPDYCSSLLRDVLDIYMVEITQDNTLDLIWDQFFERTRTNSCDGVESQNNEDVVEESRLSVINVGGIFISHAIALVVALAAAIVSRMWSYKGATSRRQSTRELTDFFGDLSAFGTSASSRNKDSKRSVTFLQKQSTTKTLPGCEMEDHTLSETSNSGTETFLSRNEMNEAFKQFDQDLTMRLDIFEKKVLLALEGSTSARPKPGFLGRRSSL